MNRFETFLLSFLFVELFVGGGGRLLDFGFLSIRQVLLVLLFITYFYKIIKNKAFFNKDINTFIRFTPVTIGIYLLLGWFFVSALIGFINGNPKSVIVMDLFRVSYIGAYFPLAYYISKSRFPMSRIVTLLKYSALVVAVYVIIIDLLGKFVFVDNFNVFYRFMNTIMNDDLYFRPSRSVFYKSHFYVLIALIISLNALLSKQFKSIDIALIIFGTISLFWSETRGFLLALMVSILMIIIIDTKIITDPIKGFMKKIQLLAKSNQFLKKTTILIVLFISIPFLFNYMTLSRFEVQSTQQQNTDDNVLEYELEKEFGLNKYKAPKREVNDVSTSTRISFIMDSKEILLNSPKNFILGTGYGSEIDGRLDGLEMSFLDIFVEQGLIGLLLWFNLFLLVFLNLYSVYRQEKALQTLDISLFAAFIGVLLLTNINPFINNPIGASFMLIVLIYSQRRKEAQQNSIKKI